VSEETGRSDPPAHASVGSAWLSSTPIAALVFGLISAASLPIGGLAGILAHPVKEQIVSRLMSFGAGSLLFAVTVELYGDVLHDIEKHGAAYEVTPDHIHKVEAHNKLGDKLLYTYCKVTLSLIACMIGAYLYHVFNRWLSAWAMGEETEGDELEAGQKKQAALVVEVWKKQVSSNSAKQLPELPLRETQSDPVHKLLNEEDDKRKYAAALAILAGTCVDGLSEGILIGFLASHNNLSIDFVASVFLANFPEAFSATSMLKGLRTPTWKIMACWTLLMLITGVSAWITALCLTGVDLHGLVAHLSSGMVEGLAAGAMMMMIISVMIPEAFEVEGDMSALVMILGFLCSIGMKVGAGYVDHLGQPHCAIILEDVPGDGIKGSVEVMVCK